MARASLEELDRQLAEARMLVEVGGRYAHYKHPELHYIVKEIGIREDTEEVSVVYEAQYGNNIPFIRALSSWLQTVEVEGKTIPRFSKV